MLSAGKPFAIAPDLSHPALKTDHSQAGNVHPEKFSLREISEMRLRMSHSSK